eukprot:SAG22_NODE_798_length_7130_cov_4.576732_3_plen_200_part_00
MAEASDRTAGSGTRRATGRDATWPRPLPAEPARRPPPPQALLMTVRRGGGMAAAGGVERGWQVERSRIGGSCGREGLPPPRATATAAAGGLRLRAARGAGSSWSLAAGRSGMLAVLCCPRLTDGPSRPVAHLAPFYRQESQARGPPLPAPPSAFQECVRTGVFVRPRGGLRGRPSMHRVIFKQVSWVVPVVTWYSFVYT